MLAQASAGAAGNRPIRRVTPLSAGIGSRRRQPEPESAPQVDGQATAGPGSDGTGADEATPPVLGLDAARRGPFTVITLAGAVCGETVCDAEAQILEAVVLAERPLRLVLDLTRVEVLDSAGVELIAKTRFAVRSAGGALCLVVPADSPVHRILTAATLERGVRLVPSLDHVLGPNPA